MAAAGDWVHNAYFDTWHFLYGQVQLPNWFGNVVAGVVVFIVVDVCWQTFLKKWVKEAIAKIHREELERHHRDVVQPALDAHLSEVKKHVTAKTKPRE